MIPGTSLLYQTYQVQYPLVISHAFFAFWKCPESELQILYPIAVVYTVSIVPGTE